MHTPGHSRRRAMLAQLHRARKRTVDVVELEPTDANALSMLDWSYDNFPPAPAIPDDGARPIA